MELDKLTLALVQTAQKLRWYFQAHPIVVLTEKPIRWLLMKPVKSEHMAKWAIELREHEIDLQVGHSIKGQVLADFMEETTEKDEENNMTFAQIITPTTESEEWKLFTDDASSSDGSGAELMLVNPEGKVFTYALRFEFNTTNNEAEYEALLVRLRMVMETKIEYLQTFIDSQLVANQRLRRTNISCSKNNKARVLLANDAPRCSHNFSNLRILPDPRQDPVETFLGKNGGFGAKNEGC
ncbi:uncharacterized protein [Rutidosis leptorrhynchoides]|uniref:uncharacterized protein n=1 Tax=Rutidosis leptorrhynchoides TaxID=125765 RepID=UPI003A9A1659